ncbi:MAG: type II toxin-antitoxin system RelE/ParE family toxin [Pseudomonadota bacterium]
MSFRVQLTRGAREDIQRLTRHLAQPDVEAARRSRVAIVRSLELLREMPFSCRKASADTPSLRELIIPFGSAGYVALFRIRRAGQVTVLAVRHQREEDYH